MKDSVFLVFDRGKVKKMYKTKPSLRRDEHAIRLDVEMDDDYFRAAIPSHKLRVAAEDVIRPEVGVVIGEGEDERMVKDPGEYVQELCQDALGGDELKGLPDWAFYAVRERLTTILEDVSHRTVEADLEEQEGGQEAVRVIRVVDQ